MCLVIVMCCGGVSSVVWCVSYSFFGVGGKGGGEA